jgi:hypothetical protein
MTEPTYGERSAEMNLEALGAELDSIVLDHADFSEAVKDVERNAVIAANKARSMGIKLQSACGHDQISFEFFHAKCKSKLPFGFETARMFISVAKKMPQPAKTIGEAVQHVQLALMAGGLLDLPERKENQSRSTVSITERFYCEFTLMKQPFDKILRMRPMENWEAKDLKQFRSEIEWAVEADKKAAALLEKK